MARTHSDSEPRGPVQARPADVDGACAQADSGRRDSLRGSSYEAQVAMLSPVQLKGEGGSSYDRQLDAQRPVQLKDSDGSSGGGGSGSGSGTTLDGPLKHGVERLSGVSMDGVTVQRNSSEPAKYQAHGIARDNEIHTAPGQDRHVPHEAWHIAQQRQGRVSATTQMKGGQGVNSDASLEAEADKMGALAAQGGHGGAVSVGSSRGAVSAGAPVQLYKKEFDSASIGTEQELTGVNIELDKNAVQRVATVTTDDDTLLDVTKDMITGSSGDRRSHTIEIVGHPVEINNDAGHLARRTAFQDVVDLIETAAANEGTLTTQGLSDGATLTVSNSDHTIHSSGREGVGRVSGSGNQATVGVALEAIGTGKDGGELVEGAPWYDRSVKSAVLDESAEYDNAATAANMYAYVLSIMKKLASLTISHKLCINEIDEVQGYEGYTGNLSHPGVKNDWGLLPRSKVYGALDILTGKDKGKVQTLLRTAALCDDATVSKHCRAYVVSGQSLAGHSIDGAKVGGKQAGLFEFRKESDIPASLLKAFWKADPTHEGVARVQEKLEATWLVSTKLVGFKYFNARDGKGHVWYVKELDDSSAVYCYEAGGAFSKEMGPDAAMELMDLSSTTPFTEE